MDSDVKIQSGLGFTSVLLIVFITLKLTGTISWSWWVVIFLPFLIELGIILAVTLFILMIVLIVGIVKAISE